MSPPIRDGSGSGIGSIRLGDGTEISEVRTGAGDVLFSGNPQITIPDSNVYLHDDWDDNKIQNRDGSGTTTYNGVTGYYRPEWTVLRDSPSASNQILVLDPGDAVSTDINLDLATDVTWTYTDFSVNGDQSGGWHVLSLYSQTQTLDDFFVYEGYQVALRESNDSFLFKVGSGGSLTQVLSWSSLGSGVFDVTVNRSSGGQWEVFVDGNSKGTVTDTEFTNPQYTSVVARSKAPANIELNEMKVN